MLKQINHHKALLQQGLTSVVSVSSVAKICFPLPVFRTAVPGYCRVARRSTRGTFAKQTSWLKTLYLLENAKIVTNSDISQQTK